jgi:carboxypeptidase Taq
MTEKMQKFKQIVRQNVLLDNTRSLLSWDQETYMPPRAGAGRGEQISLISRLLHERSTSGQYAGLLNELWQNREQFDQNDQRFLRVKKRSLDLATKLPVEFVGQLAKASSQAQLAWVKAKKENNFDLFLPRLAELVYLNKEKASILNPQADAYEVLMDHYEEGLTTAQMDQVFTALNPVTREIIAKYASKTQPKLSQESFSISKQKEVSRWLLEYIGYDFEQGNLDEVAHPFMTRLGKFDSRVTNSYDESHLSALFSALHEGGHALFEQGFNEDYSDLLGDDERSLGIHESQSRFWENIIGRSRDFWLAVYPKVQKAFGLDDLLENFLEHINFVQPSLVRVEADEVSYNLHIQIRFELEKELIRGNLPPQEIPQAWNQKHEEYLGLRPRSDSQGCLQDVHWSIGNFGYFPTYTLGNVISAQFWQAYQKFDSNYSHTIQTGNLAKIRQWQKENIHDFGPLTPTAEILWQSTGQELSPEPFVEYLRGKYLAN